MNDEYQRIAANAIAHAAAMAGESVRQAAYGHGTPSAVFRPRLFIDQGHWCALYGENLQDGVAGFGKSPAHAMESFDKAWAAALPPQINQRGIDR